VPSCCRRCKTGAGSKAVSGESSRLAGRMKLPWVASCLLRTESGRPRPELDCDPWQMGCGCCTSCCCHYDLVWLPSERSWCCDSGMTSWNLCSWEEDWFAMKTYFCARRRPVFGRCSDDHGWSRSQCPGCPRLLVVPGSEDRMCCGWSGGPG
jgi:hypothetical protein